MTYEIQYTDSDGWARFYTIRANSAKHACMKFKNLFGCDVKVIDIKGQYSPQYHYALNTSNASSTSTYSPYVTWYYSGSPYVYGN